MPPVVKEKEIHTQDQVNKERMAPGPLSSCEDSRTAILLSFDSDVSLLRLSAEYSSATLYLSKKNLGFRLSLLLFLQETNAFLLINANHAFILNRLSH